MNAVFFAVYIPTIENKNLIEEFFSFFKKKKNLVVAYVGIQHGSIDNIEKIINEVKGEIRVVLRHVDSNLSVDSDASSFVAALEAYKDDLLKQKYSFFYFVHTKGVTSGQDKLRNYLLNDLFCENVDYFFSNPDIGSYGPFITITENKEDIKKMSCLKNFYKRKTYNILEYYYLYTFYIIRGEIIENFVKNSIDDFFKYHVNSYSDRYMMERDFPHICDMLGYAPSFKYLSGNYSNNYRDFLLEDYLKKLTKYVDENKIQKKINDLSFFIKKKSFDKEELSVREIILRRSTPVIINSFNQLTYLKNLVEKLLSARFENIYILDQGSSYPPLMKWLSGVYERKEALPLFLGKNNGPHYFFISELYKVFEGNSFIYTDPDISWKTLAHDFLSYLFDISEKYKTFKVGPALEIPNNSDIKDIKIRDQKGNIFSIKEWESQFWKNQIEPGVYNSPIDTTFHLFVPKYYCFGNPLITGLRVSGSGRTILHLPWHKSFSVPEEEHNFYYDATKYSTTLPAYLCP